MRQSLEKRPIETTELGDSDHFADVEKVRTCSRRLLSDCCYLYLPSRRHIDVLRASWIVGVARLLFKRGNYFIQHFWRCGHYSRVVTNREQSFWIKSSVVIEWIQCLKIGPENESIASMSPRGIAPNYTPVNGMPHYPPPARNQGVPRDFYRRSWT